MTEYQKCMGCGKWTNAKEVDVFADETEVSLCRSCSMTKREKEYSPSKGAVALAATVLSEALKVPTAKKVREKRVKKGGE